MIKKAWTAEDAEAAEEMQSGIFVSLFVSASAV